MNYTLDQFIDEAIQLELHAAEIYFVFADALPEDANFWTTLAWEEKNHAAVLQSCKKILMPKDLFPVEILPNIVQVLVDTNRWLHSLKEKFAEVGPDRETAFATAIKIENSAGEQHFQRVMETPSDSHIIKILQELCKDDIHHLNRIRDYMEGGAGLGEMSDIETKNILLVISEENVARLLDTILETEGHIDSVGNGRDALQLIREQDYDLIISSIEMPMVDGIEFYKQARELVSDLNKKLLFFIGAPTLEQTSFLQAEDISYVLKPSTIDGIRDAALVILGGSQ